MPPDGVTSYRTPCGSVASDGSPPYAPTLVSDQRWWLADAVAPGDAVSRTVPSTARPDSSAVRTGTRRDIGRLPPLGRTVTPGGAVAAAFGVAGAIPVGGRRGKSGGNRTRYGGRHRRLPPGCH